MKKNLILILLLVLIFSTGCSDSIVELEDITYPYPDTKDLLVTLDNFEKISTGMSLDEVWEVVGGVCSSIGVVDSGLGDEYISESYGCNGDGSIGANVLLTFQGGKLVTKVQSGLK